MYILYLIWTLGLPREEPGKKKKEKKKGMFTSPRHLGPGKICATESIFLNNDLVAALNRCSVRPFCSAKVEHVKTKNTGNSKHRRVEMKSVMGHQRFFLPWNTIVCVCARVCVCMRHVSKVNLLSPQMVPDEQQTTQTSQQWAK